MIVIIQIDTIIVQKIRGWEESIKIGVTHKNFVKSIWDKNGSPIIERILGNIVMITVVDIVEMGDFNSEESEHIKHANKIDANNLNM